MILIISKFFELEIPAVKDFVSYHIRLAVGDKGLSTNCLTNAEWHKKDFSDASFYLSILVPLLFFFETK